MCVAAKHGLYTCFKKCLFFDLDPLKQRTEEKKLLVGICVDEPNEPWRRAGSSRKNGARGAPLMMEPQTEETFLTEGVGEGVGALKPHVSQSRA